MYSGRTSAYAHKRDDWEAQSLDDTPPALKHQLVLDAQWTDCPIEVENDVKKLWRHYELGNDHYMLRRSILDLEEIADGTITKEWKDNEWKKVPLTLDALIAYLRQHGVAEDEDVIIHWWW